MVLVKIFSLLVFCLPLYAQDVEVIKKEAKPAVEEGVDADGQVIYKYKKEEYFDFGALQVEGEILAPSDLTDKVNKRIRFQINDHIRKDFDDFIREDLIDIQ